MKVPEDVAELFNKIYQNKVVLFIGNGATVDVGGPKTRDLVAAIKKAFPEAIYRGDDFIHTCTDVMETTRTSRRELEQLIKKKLFDLKPGSFHTELPLHIWRAIFTTNFDDLIEQGLKWTPSVGQDRGLIKRESCHSYSVCCQGFYHVGASIFYGTGVHLRWCAVAQ